MFVLFWGCAGACTCGCGKHPLRQAACGPRRREPSAAKGGSHRGPRGAPASGGGGGSRGGGGGGRVVSRLCRLDRRSSAPSARENGLTSSSWRCTANVCCMSAAIDGSAAPAPAPAGTSPSSSPSRSHRRRRRPRGRRGWRGWHGRRGRRKRARNGGGGGGGAATTDDPTVVPSAGVRSSSDGRNDAAPARRPRRRRRRRASAAIAAQVGAAPRRHLVVAAAAIRVGVAPLPRCAARSARARQRRRDWAAPWPQALAAERRSGASPAGPPSGPAATAPSLVGADALIQGQIGLSVHVPVGLGPTTSERGSRSAMCSVCRGHAEAHARHQPLHPLRRRRMRATSKNDSFVRIYT